MNLGWKLISLATGAAAGFVAQKVTDVIWEKGFGKQKPAGDDSDLEKSASQIVMFAVVTAAVNAAVTEAVRRKTQKWYAGRQNTTLRA